MAHRPAYPSKLYDMICEYHQVHGGRFETALDVGGGIGIVAQEFLLKKFAHTTLSDPSDMYISQAKTALASIKDPKQLSFLACKIEDMRPKDLPNGPVDLMTAGTCLHWADMLKVTPTAAQLIKSGGTFSAWTYGIKPVFPEHLPAAQTAWNKLMSRMMELYELKVGKQGPPAANMNARFDNMPFGPDTWRDVRRFQVLASEPMVDASLPVLTKKILPEETQQVLDDDAFICRDVDYQWMIGYLQSLIPPVDVRDNMAEELEVLRNAMEDEVLQLRWPFALVLATRK